MAVTMRGTKAGDPLGDLLYNFLAARLFSNVRQRLQEENLCFRLQYDGRRSLTAASGHEDRLGPEAAAGGPQSVGRRHGGPSSAPASDVPTEDPCELMGCDVTYVDDFLAICRTRGECFAARRRES